MLKKYLVAIVIIVACLPACCPMVSVNPLSAPDGFDERLFGVWKPESKSDTSQNILNFIEAGDFDALFPDAMRFTRIKPAIK